jgi:hypothetical protein
MDLNSPKNDAFPSSFHPDDQHINNDYYYESAKAYDKRHYKDTELDDKIYESRFDEISYPDACYRTQLMNIQETEEKTQNLIPNLFSCSPITENEPQTLYIPLGWPFPILQNGTLHPPHEMIKKIGKLSPEERLRIIKKYRDKKIKRKFERKITYACRKEVADKRMRVQGRFLAKKDAIEIVKKMGHSESELAGDINNVNKLLNNSNAKEILKAKRSNKVTKSIAI